ncbi:CASP-like protein 1D1 [Lolium perenne]|uniref:CASP-like protein 1D1 n=1 Tax=Lolium perenne TaxID=4522 RepID=UPI0021EACA84|nr:CASP-like protein 1D1 [Lolium perenne]
MASTVKDSEQAALAPSPPAKLRPAELVLRLLLFAASLSGLVVLVTGKQTAIVPVVLTPPFRFGPVAAEFTNSPALIYLLVALCMTCLYSLLTAASSVKSGGSSCAKKIFVHTLLDVYHAAVMASATGAAAAVAWVGLKGNEHTRWNKICNVYDKFCRHIGTATALGLVASILLVLLAGLNAYSLYRRRR